MLQDKLCIPDIPNLKHEILEEVHNLMYVIREYQDILDANKVLPMDWHKKGKL